jgi:hypothetical protein
VVTFETQPFSSYIHLPAKVGTEIHITSAIFLKVPESIVTQHSIWLGGGYTDAKQTGAGKRG